MNKCYRRDGVPRPELTPAKMGNGEKQKKRKRFLMPRRARLYSPLFRDRHAAFRQRQFFRQRDFPRERDSIILETRVLVAQLSFPPLPLPSHPEKGPRRPEKARAPFWHSRYRHDEELAGGLSIITWTAPTLTKDDF